MMTPVRAHHHAPFQTTTWKKKNIKTPLEYQRRKKEEEEKYKGLVAGRPRDGRTSRLPKSVANLCWAFDSFSFTIFYVCSIHSTHGICIYTGELQKEKNLYIFHWKPIPKPIISSVCGSYSHWGKAVEKSPKTDLKCCSTLFLDSRARIYPNWCWKSLKKKKRKREKGCVSFGGYDGAVKWTVIAQQKPQTPSLYSSNYKNTPRVGFVVGLAGW